MKKRTIKLLALTLVAIMTFFAVGCSGCDWSMFDALFEIQPDVPSGEWNSPDDTTSRASFIWTFPQTRSTRRCV